MATTKLPFNTKYGTKNEVVSNPGDPIKIEHQLVIKENGEHVLEPCGQTNTDEMIESYAASVDINQILARYQAGDVNALDKVRGFYADVSDLPVKLSDVMNINLRGKELFDSFPVEYKQLYGQDYLQFVNDPGKLISYIEGKNNVGSVAEEKEISANDDEK